MGDKKQELYAIIQKMKALKVSKPRYAERVSDLISLVKGVAERTSEIKVDPKQIKQEIAFQKDK